MNNISNIITTILFPLHLLSLGSCANIQSYANCDVHTDSQLPSLHPSEYGVSLLSTQQITINTTNDKFEFVSLLEVQPDKLSLVALTPIGQKLFQLQYRKQKLDYSGQGVPADFYPAYLLSDISLIYGKTKSLEYCFAQIRIPFTLDFGESYTDNHITRLIKIGNTEKITIEYSTKEIWESNITFTNHTRDYSIIIKPLSVERL